MKKWPEIYGLFRGAFEGSINVESLKLIDRIGLTSRYRCPCGGKDHFATCTDICRSELSDVLHCYYTGKQWLIDRDAARIIKGEEESFFALLKKHEDKAGKWCEPAEAFRLWSEQGVPWEMLQCTDERSLALMVDEHREKSRKKPMMEKNQ